jgi:hypothetical protein
VLLEAHRVGERVHGKRVLLCALDTEEVDPGAQPQDEIVIREGSHLCELHLAPGEIDAGDRGLVDGDVRLFVEQVAQRMAARCGFQQVGGHLVQERLEGVVVVLVDHRDIDLGLLELPGHTHAAEATAKDEHMRTRALSTSRIRRRAAGR